MKHRDYTTSITVKASAKEAYEGIMAITKWWTENVEGSSQKLNDEFTVRFWDVHVSTQRITEWMPHKKIVWLVTNSQLNFLKDKEEWTGTTISFDITEKNKETHIQFTHHGLNASVECHTACSTAWQEYIHGSLKLLLDTGTGKPTIKEMRLDAK